MKSQIKPITSGKTPITSNNDSEIQSSEFKYVRLFQKADAPNQNPLNDYGHNRISDVNWGINVSATIPAQTAGEKVVPDGVWYAVVMDDKA